MIEPRVVKGFRDILPAKERDRLEWIHILEDVYSSRGFEPIDTPALEYSETLLGKSGGETEKQIFRFTDAGGRDVAMRFDLTVPFARFLAQHGHEIGLPFKRFHIAKVWRGENPQKGRYREFMQADFDAVGVDSLAADLDILLTVNTAMNKLLPGAKFVIKMSHRGIFSQYLEQLGCLNRAEEILRIMDKSLKAPQDVTDTALAGAIGEKKEELKLLFIKEATFIATLERAEALVGACEPLTRMREIYKQLGAMGLLDRFELDFTITRGLDYYTGLVFETFLTDLPSIGSICSGGRYDNLVGLYAKDPITGVGGSIGLDRLMAACEERNIRPAGSVRAGRTLILYTPRLDRAYACLADIVAAGYSAEIYLAEAKEDKQYKYAERRGMEYVLVLMGDTLRIKRQSDRLSRDCASMTEVINFMDDAR